MFNSKIFLGKKILITGSTGFKGSWLSIWLNLLGANYMALHWNRLQNHPYLKKRLDQVIENHIINIKCSTKVSNLVNDISPDFIFHLAAQPLVKYSYSNPIETWKTNVVKLLIF